MQSENGRDSVARPMQRGLSRGSQFTEQLGCGGLLLRAALCREEGGRRRHERKVREKGARETAGENETENGGGQGYQCGRWLLAAK